MHNFDIAILTRSLQCLACLIEASQMSARVSRLQAELRIAMTCGTAVASWPRTYIACAPFYLLRVIISTLPGKQWNHQMCPR